MELQCLLVAGAYRINPEGTLSKAHIFQRVTVPGPPPVKTEISVLAKIKFGPLKVGETDHFTFRLEHQDSNELVEIELPYTYPDFQAWLIVPHAAI